MEMGTSAPLDATTCSHVNPNTLERCSKTKIFAKGFCSAHYKAYWMFDHGKGRNPQEAREIREPQSVQIATKVTEDVFNVVMRQAIIDNLSSSEVVRQIIVEWAGRQPKDS